jgi:S-adenosylmethionine hydrolase
MTIITLTTDWHNDDFYTGAIKGLLYGKCPDVKVIDITHKIDTFKYTQAAFILRNVYKYYPPGTIHIVGIQSNINENQHPVCIKTDNQYFIGSSGGIFSLIFDKKPDIVIKINETDTIKRSTFPELTIFAETAAMIANGTDIKQLGSKFTEMTRFMQIMPAVDKGVITGQIIYIDSYKNVITNISEQLFYDLKQDKKFVMAVKSDSYKVNKISIGYSDVERGEILALFNSAGLLEFAMRDGKIAELADIQINTPVIVKYL